MATCQLNVRVEVGLARRLRQAAKAQHTTPGALVAQALELLLAGNSKGPAPALAADSKALGAALAALEQRVGALEQQHTPRPALTPKAKAEPQPVAEPRLPIDDPARGITTAELAERTGTNRAAWNNWAGAPGRIGEVRNHPQAGAWRLLGKAAPPTGGPERWLWEPAG